MSGTKARFAAAVALTLALPWLAACEVPISDTGYVGAWQYGHDDGARAVLAVWKDDQGYHAHVNRFGRDGEHVVRCETAGTCIGYSGRDKQYEIHYRAYESDAYEGLVVEREIVPLIAGGHEAHNLDRYVVEPGGLELSKYLVETNHEKREPEGGPIRFRKIADDPFHF